MNNTNAKGIPLPKHEPTENINPTPTDSVQALKEELATVFKKDNTQYPASNPISSSNKSVLHIKKRKKNGKKPIL